MKLPENVVKAGENMASMLMDAQVSKCMDGLGGSKTWEEWLGEDFENKDLVVRYLNEEINSIEAIYLAMQRAQDIKILVKIEPDYWEGSHFHSGSKPYIEVMHLWKLNPGEKLIKSYA